MAHLIVYPINGNPFNDRMFFLGILFEPPSAGIKQTLLILQM